MRPFAIRTLYQQVKFDVPRHLPKAIFSSIALSYHSVSCLIEISQIQSKIPGTHRLPPGKGTVCVYPVGPILTEYLTKGFSLNFISSLTFIFVKGWWRMQRSPLVCIICMFLKCSWEQNPNCSRHYYKNCTFFGKVPRWCLRQQGGGGQSDFDNV